MTRARAWAQSAVMGGALAACAQAAAGQSSGAASISNGIGALARRDAAGAAREFRRAARDSSPALRSVGEQWLGHLSWMVNADARTAAEHLDRAMIGARDSSAILVERARLLGFQRRYRDAARTAVAAMRSGAESERHGLAARTLVGMAVDGAFAAMTANASIADSVEPPIVREALDTLRERVNRFPGRTTDALALLDGGALLGDRDEIATASASYFLLRHRSARPSLAQPGDGVASLATRMADNRLYEPAALLLEGQRGRTTARLTASAEDALAYGLFLHRLRADVNEFYRRAVLGLAREGDLDRALNVRTRALWPLLHWQAPAPPYYPAAVPAELAKRFGAVMSIEHGAAIPELHLAHAIEAYTATPTESPARGRVVVLDAVASNGAESWLLVGAGGRAGWVSGDSILEIRTAFTETPFRAWLAMTDPRTSAAELFQHDDDADLARARADSAAYLPGVAARLFRAGASIILDSLAREAMSEAQRQAAFVGILFDQLTGTTIALHELRHLADARRPNGRVSEAEAEFRAKIDEVALARRPKLAMTAILHPNIGDATPHGRANRRIMLGLIRWIRAHSTEIPGFDASIPALVQLPLLSDAQLRAAFQSMRGAA